MVSLPLQEELELKVDQQHQEHMLVQRKDQVPPLVQDLVQVHVSEYNKICIYFVNHISYLDDGSSKDFTIGSAYIGGSTTSRYDGFGSTSGVGGSDATYTSSIASGSGSTTGISSEGSGGSFGTSTSVGTGSGSGIGCGSGGSGCGLGGKPGASGNLGVGGGIGVG